MSPRIRTLVATVAANLGILALTIVTGTLNARLLGPAGRGELAAIQTIPSFLGMIALLGLPNAVGYFSARRPAEARSFAVTATLMCLMASIPAMIVGYFVIPWALHSQSSTVVHHAQIYLVFIALQAIVQMPYVALHGLGHFSAWNFMRLAPNIAALGTIAVVAATGGFTSGRFSGWYLVLYALIIPLSYGVLWRRTHPVVVPKPGRARDLLGYGLPNALMIPAGLLNLQLDQMMMAAWLPSSMLGLYAVSVSWSGLVSPVFGALGSVIFPALASGNPEGQRLLAAKSIRFAVLMLVVVGAGLAAVTPFLLPIFFGSAFADAVPVTLILIVAGMQLSLNGLCAEVLRGLGVPRWPLYSQIAALPVTVLMLVLLLPRWSIVGAGVSSLVAYIVAGSVCIIGIHRTCGIGLREMLLPGRAEVAALINIARQLVSRRQQDGAG